MTSSVRYCLEDLVTHRGNMLLLDRVIDADALHTTVEVVITAQSSFYQAPLGVPAWVGIEYMAQAVAVLGGVQAQLDGDPAPMGYLLGTRKYACQVPWFENGWVLQVSCEETVLDGNGLGAYNCRIETDRLLAESRLTIYKKPPKESDL